jgi:hypothetical protein
MISVRHKPLFHGYGVGKMAIFAVFTGNYADALLLGHDLITWL